MRVGERQQKEKDARSCRIGMTTKKDNSEENNSKPKYTQNDIPVFD